MRTKTLLLSVALSAAGAATAMAQTVYSVNIVGYMNKTLPAGYSLIGNQLNATPDNSPATIFGNPTHPLTVIQFNRNSGTFTSANYDPDLGWSQDPPVGPTVPEVSMAPGRAAYVNVPDNITAGMPVTFVGEVVLTSNLEIRPGLDMYSPVLPIAGTIESLGLPSASAPVPPGTTVTIQQFVGGAFVPSSYNLDDFGGWDNAAGGPTIGLNEGFWIDNFRLTPPAVSFFWPRSFSVGPP